MLRKRPDGFHDLDTVFYPFFLQDALEIVHKPSATTEVEFSSTGAVVDVLPSENICVKAYQLLKSNFPDLPPVTMHLHKTIPSGAGLGGGSADGAFTLLLLNRKMALGLSEDRLIDYALQLGSDCPFFIKNTPCHATGRGEKMESLPLDLSPYKFVLVNPGLHVSTAWAFSRIKPSAERTSLKESIQLPVAEWEGKITNDFEEPVMHHHPEIARIKDALYKQGAVFAGMTGSGSTVYGIFFKEAEPSLRFPLHYLVKTA